MHGTSHEGMVLSRVQLLVLHALIRVKDRVVGCANSVFASVCIVLLCRYVFRLFMCLFMQHDSRWRGMCHFGGMCIGYMLGIRVV